ncbi:CoA transferase [Ectopseudomonas mendocina]|uniref:CoA transferase n=1 Tax=Ectopseudomonas mendocina TaxID=300 RepID=UPI0005A9E666|nr:CoA transferase [Pseudomonas mendocina]VEE14778.1 CAIB/BAIF family protein [Pseudomonas mendocina]
MNPMTFPLAGCTLSGAFVHTPAAFAPVASALCYQAGALGIEVMNQPGACADGLDLRFVVPGLAPIGGRLCGWADGRSIGAGELTVQAASGLLAVHGRASGGARPLGVDYVSTLAASLALQGAFAAAIGQLHGRSHSQVNVSLAGAATLAIGQYLAGATAPEGAERLLPGCTSSRERPPFTSADGVVFELETLDAEPWRRFWGDLGIPGELAGKGWGAFLLRYAKAVSPMPVQLMEALSQLPYAVIAQRCAAAGLSICPLRSLHQRLADEDLPLLLEQGPWRFTSGSSGLSPNPVRERGDLPLSGLRVIESCRRIQGPLAGHLLALLGAEVIRIELPGGDPLRGMPPLVDGCSVRFDALNRHKSVCELDIKSARGRAELLELASQADVFLHNWAPGKAAELGLEHADLARANRALIYAYAGGWGEQPHLQRIPGTDFMVQAYSGVASQIARRSASAGGSLFTVLDVLGGVVATQGISAALLKRGLKGEAGRVDSSLLGAATLLCSEPLRALRDGKAPAEPQVAGVYPTAAGLLAIECRNSDDVECLRQALDYPLDIEPALRDEQIVRCLATRDAHAWQELLQAFGLAAASVAEDLSTLHQDERIAPCLHTEDYTLVKSPWSFT